MKLKKGNVFLFFWLTIVFFLVGGMLFEILKYLFPDFAWFFDIGIPKVGFNLEIISIYIKVNLGSIIGFIIGVFLFNYY